VDLVAAELAAGAEIVSGASVQLRPILVLQVAAAQDLILIFLERQLGMQVVVVGDIGVQIFLKLEQAASEVGELVVQAQPLILQQLPAQQVLAVEVVEVEATVV
jgi:hypothetical protein